VVYGFVMFHPELKINQFNFNNNNNKSNIDQVKNNMILLFELITNLHYFRHNNSINLNQNRMI